MSENRPIIPEISMDAAASQEARRIHDELEVFNGPKGIALIVSNHGSEVAIQDALNFLERDRNVKIASTHVTDWPVVRETYKALKRIDNTASPTPVVAIIDQIVEYPGKPLYFSDEVAIDMLEVARESGTESPYFVGVGIPGMYHSHDRNLQRVVGERYLGELFGHDRMNIEAKIAEVLKGK